MWNGERRREIPTWFWCGNLKEGAHSKDLVIDGRILKWIGEMWVLGQYLTEDRDKWTFYSIKFAVFWLIKQGLCSMELSGFVTSNRRMLTWRITENRRGRSDCASFRGIIQHLGSIYDRDAHLWNGPCTHVMLGLLPKDRAWSLTRPFIYSWKQECAELHLHLPVLYVVMICGKCYYSTFQSFAGTNWRNLGNSN